MSEELADGDFLFSLLGEFRPIRAHPLFVVEPTLRVGERQRHRRQTLGRGPYQDHGVLLPGLARLLVSDTAPEVHDFLASVVDAAGAAQLSASSEILNKSLADGLEAAADVPLNVGRLMLPWASSLAFEIFFRQHVPIRIDL